MVFTNHRQSQMSKKEGRVARVSFNISVTFTYSFPFTKLELEEFKKFTAKVKTSPGVWLKKKYLEEQEVHNADKIRVVDTSIMKVHRAYQGGMNDRIGIEYDTSSWGLNHLKLLRKKLGVKK